MTRLVPALLALWIAAAAGAQETTTIAGRCVDDEGRAIPRAKVYLHLTDHHEQRDELVRMAMADEEGHFSFEARTIPPAEYGWTYYHLIAEAPGRAVGVATLRKKSIALDELELRLGEPDTVAGEVRDRDDQPIPNARVWAMRIARGNYEYVFLSQPNVLLETKTDERGRFELGSLPRGAGVELVATEPLHARLRHLCRAGDEVLLELDPGAVVTGRVVFAGGKPAAGVLVCAQGTMNSSWATTRTNGDGSYRLESLIQEPYNIWSKTADWTVRAHDSFQTEAGRETPAPDLVFVRGGWIAGTVIDGATERPVQPGEASDVGLYGPSRPRSGAAIESANIGPDGTFRIRAAPGSNYVYLRPRGPWSKASHTVDVREGETVRVKFVTRKGKD